MLPLRFTVEEEQAAKQTVNYFKNKTDSKREPSPAGKLYFREYLPHKGAYPPLA